VNVSLKVGTSCSTPPEKYYAPHAGHNYPSSTGISIYCGIRIHLIHLGLESLVDYPPLPTWRHSHRSKAV